MPECEKAGVIKEVIAWQLAEAMRTRKLSRNTLATLMKTSRTQVARVLDSAEVVGRKVRLELV